MRPFSRLAAVGLLAAAPCLVGCGSASPYSPFPQFRFATLNLYYGADLTAAIFAVETGDPDLVVEAVTGTWEQVQATDYRVRAEALADEIARAAPDLLGLQEAALWRVQEVSDAFTADPTPAEAVALDFVEILRGALAARGLAYDAVAVSEGFDVELPFVDEDLALKDLRLTDREVVLARRDFAGGTLENPQAGHFAVNLVLGSGVEIRRGWASIDVRTDGGVLRFVTTHLEAEVPEVRDAQAAELLSGPLAGSAEVVLVGDFNDDALAPAPGGAYETLSGAGLADAWGADAGETCCADALLADPDAAFTQRLDVVFLRGAFTVEAATLFGADPSSRRGGLWPSDHAGVVVTAAR